MKFTESRRGASLLLSFHLDKKYVIVVGSGKLAANRAFACVEADAHVIVLGRGGLENACEEIKWRVAQNEIEWRGIEEAASSWNAAHTPTVDDLDEAALLSVLTSVSPVSFLCITDTLISSASNAPPRNRCSAMKLYEIASTVHRIPTNVTDMADLCDFSFPSTHRFRSAINGEPTALQIGVVTNSKGCRLSSRINREIVARLPKGIGDAVDNVGLLRDKAKVDDNTIHATSTPSTNVQPIPQIDHGVDTDLPATPNEPASQQSHTDNRTDTPLSRTQRRIRWVAQVSEFWPLDSLANLKEEEIHAILDGDTTQSSKVLEGISSNTISPAPTLHTMPPLAVPSVPGRIFLVGSGPGHPSLLTVAASKILQSADLILSDKLVPETVLNTIPKSVELRIARKFPGNADKAQEELMHIGLKAARQGKVVVRLKQGDPMLYARVSSEIEYFTAHGFPPSVIPGLSSAFAAPLSANIPVTARGVSDSVMICTGVGRGGAAGRIPRYERSTTVLVLMGVARLPEIIQLMVEDLGYPDCLPVCIIERGTMVDQRVISSTLNGITEAMTSPRIGSQRPPGMMVVGWTCMGFFDGIEGVSEDAEPGSRERDLRRVNSWLRGEPFIVKEGLDKSWDNI